MHNLCGKKNFTNATKKTWTNGEKKTWQIISLIVKDF